jgi:hypothetical protein
VQSGRLLLTTEDKCAYAAVAGMCIYAYLLFFPHLFAREVSFLLVATCPKINYLSEVQPAFVVLLVLLA